MTSRMKKLFHRKKDDEQGQSPKSNKSNPTLGTSLYESTSAAGQPQLGDYPIKGNDSSAMLQQQGRKSSVRSRRSSGSQFNVPWRSPTPDQQTGRQTPRMSPPPGHHSSGTERLAPYQHQTPMPASEQGNRKRLSRTPLPQDFANLSLGDDGPRTVTQTVTTTSFSPGPNGPRNSHTNSNGNLPNGSNIPPRGQSAAQPLDGFKFHSQEPTPNVATDGYNTSSGQQDHGHDLKRKTSIPRKQIGTTATPISNNPDPFSPRSVRADSRQQGNGGNYGPLSSRLPPNNPASSKPHQSRTDYDQRANEAKITSKAHVPFRDGKEHRKVEAASQASGVLDRTRPISSRATIPRDAQDIVDRAKSNTYDTQVVESVVPAVTHETVHRKVHNVREELTTKEIHTRDVYHRILPVIDVEVLPPRHFLPVEGGGLVEISASEVPGRENNWVIAETASKIPSDQAAPKGTRGFTACKFPGRDGDAVRRDVDGHERTEETWVHQPELETGARDTGQSWPMVFGSDVAGKGTYGYTSPVASKEERPERRSMPYSGRARHSEMMGKVQ